MSAPQTAALFSDPQSAALIAAAAAVFGVFLTQFLAEAYRRFKDGSALAAGLQGELSSYMTQKVKMRANLDRMVHANAGGKRDILNIRPVALDGDLFFDSSIARLGLLGAPLMADTIQVYLKTRMFKKLLELISKEHDTMSPGEFGVRCLDALTLLDEVVEKAELLIPKLASRANAIFLWPWQHRG